MWLKGCPKCHGDLMAAEDMYGPYIYCLQCGYAHDLEKEKNPLPPPETHTETGPGGGTLHGGNPRGVTPPARRNKGPSVDRRLSLNSRTRNRRGIP